MTHTLGRSQRTPYAEFVVLLIADGPAGKSGSSKSVRRWSRLALIWANSGLPSLAEPIIENANDSEEGDSNSRHVANRYPPYDYTLLVLLSLL